MMNLEIIEFTQQETELIDSKMSDPSFSVDSWTDDSLSSIKKRIKDHYLKVQKYKCPYCKQVFRTRNGRVWDIEHVISRSQELNFMFAPQNLCVSCVDCNIAKSNKKVTKSKARKRLPTKSSLYLIVHPHFDKYSDSILAIRPGFYYIALDSKGQKTIEICQLCRFHEYAGFTNMIGGKDKIYWLSEQLKETNDTNEQKAILKEIALYAINGAIASKE